MKKNTPSIENWDTRDDEPLNRSCLQKFLNRPPAIHIGMLHPARGQAPEDFTGLPGHQLNGPLELRWNREDENVAQTSCLQFEAVQAGTCATSSS